jgi:hypothetical protein
MSDSFALLDLPSQTIAVQRLLKGRAEVEKLAWLAARGELSQVATLPNERPIYRFVSTVGMECSFFIAGDKFVFMGDNTTFTAKEHDPA